MIAIIDYGIGNLRSISYKLGMLKTTAVITSDPAAIAAADKIILPGVGHFAEGMRNIEQRGLVQALSKAVEENVPVLGICLGMQLMTLHSEEGNSRGLGWVQARTRRFDFSDSSRALRIPHMGWNEVAAGRESPLLSGLDGTKRFYFANSYYVVAEDAEITVATTEYGIPFVSIFQKENIFGVQFHPEKSHEHGLRVLDNFIKLKQ